VNLEPQIVLEVKFNEIQKSLNYASGYALGIQRIVQIETITALTMPKRSSA